jgi:hypothetical protein
MVQYSQRLSKASQFEISFAMHENFKMGVTVCFVHFSLRWFLPVEVRLYSGTIPLTELHSYRFTAIIIFKLLH